MRQILSVQTYVESPFGFEICGLASLSITRSSRANCAYSVIRLMYLKLPHVIQSVGFIYFSCDNVIVARELWDIGCGA